MMVSDQVKELIGYLNGVMVDAKKSDNGKHAPAKRVRKAMMEVVKKAKEIRNSRYDIAYGPKAGKEG